ncbi:MAG: DNA polymerase III subunit beta [Gammaproteobacteria bacterium]|nr:DNA polymerase III subunit beta [Gammaproteobacteria bacterium]
MKLSFTREQILTPLQKVTGAVEKRQTMPILANILLEQNEGFLQITGTDLEIELVARTDIAIRDSLRVTIPARKLFDICKNLQDGSEINVTVKEDRVTLISGRSRFVLASLPANDFPSLEEISADITFTVKQNVLKNLIERTAFAMAQQDVRYYLNGMLLEIRGDTLRAIATDGHRLAMTDSDSVPGLVDGKQVIVPRKGVLELQRLLEDSEEEAKVSFGSNHICVEFSGLRYTSKLIDGRFPDYERVMPASAGTAVTTDRLGLRQSLTRTSILSNEKYRGVRLVLSDNMLKIQTQNPDKEEAEEEVEVEYDGEEMEVAFNVNYLLDALNAIDSDKVQIIVTDANSSCLIRDQKVEQSKYVIMPMRL